MALRWQYEDKDVLAWFRVFEGDTQLYVVELGMVSGMVQVLLPEGDHLVAVDLTERAGELLPEELADELRYAWATSRWRRRRRV
jgi:hypothetical protein